MPAAYPQHDQVAKPVQPEWDSVRPERQRSDGGFVSGSEANKVRGVPKAGLLFVVQSRIAGWRTRAPYVEIDGAHSMGRLAYW